MRGQWVVVLLGLLVGSGGVWIWRRVTALQMPVKVMPSRLDLGVIEKGETRPFSLTVLNMTRQPLRLVRVRYSVCGCFFERQRFPKVLLPGQPFSLAFGLQTKQLEAGPLHEHLILLIATPDGQTFSSTVTLVGTIHQTVTADPPELRWRGVLVGQAVTTSLTLQSGVGKPFRITKIRAPSEVQVRPLSSSFALAHRLKVTFRPLQRPGWRNEKLRIEYGQRPRRRERWLFPFGQKSSASWTRNRLF